VYCLPPNNPPWPPSNIRAYESGASTRMCSSPIPRPTHCQRGGSLLEPCNIPLGDRAPVHHHVRRGDSQCTTNKILPSSTGVVKLILQPRHPGRADRGQRRRRDAIHYPPSASGPPARTIRPRIAIFDHDCPLLVASGVGVAPPIGCQGQILCGAVREDTHSLSSESSSYGCS